MENVQKRPGAEGFGKRKNDSLEGRGDLVVKVQNAGNLERGGGKPKEQGKEKKLKG